MHSDIVSALKNLPPPYLPYCSGQRATLSVCRQGRQFAIAKFPPCFSLLQYNTIQVKVLQGFQPPSLLTRGETVVLTNTISHLSCRGVAAKQLFAKVFNASSAKMSKVLTAQLDICHIFDAFGGLKMLHQMCESICGKNCPEQKYAN